MALRWDEFELDVPARRLHGADGPVHVEPQVFDVLVFLVEHRDRVVTKEELLDGVWGDQFVSESALTTRIKSVRQALGDDGRTQRYIRNVHGRGYQFVGELDDGAGPDRAEHSLPPAVPVSLALSISVDDEYPFVGRQAELDLIDGHMSAADGSSRIFIAGAPGLGKSRLALEVLERAAARGAAVCAGRCDEQLTSDLQPIRDAVAQLAAAGPAEFAGWSAGLEGQLSGLIPSVGALLGTEPIQVDGYAAVDVMLTILERVAADRPVVLLVDDLQWSDEPSRSLLAQLHRRFGHRPITSLATLRSGSTDLPPGPRAWIAEQGRLPGSLRLDLAELAADDAAQLVETVVGRHDEQEIDELVARTGGHGLFLTESLRDHQRGVRTSASVFDLVTARLDRLPDEVQRLVNTGAVLGADFSFAIAARAADLEPAAALDAIDQAMSAEVLHETSSASRFRFSHQLVPEAIRAAMTRPARALVHHRCAMALEVEADADPVEVATHFLGAVPMVQTEEALARSVAAAAGAIESNQFDRAIRLLELSLEVEGQTRQRAEILVMIGDALVSSGRTEAGVPRFEEAAELARRNGWVDILVAAALGHFGRSPFRRPTDDSTRKLLEEALAALGDEPSIERARLLAKMAAFSLFAGRLRYRDRMSRKALEMAVDAPPLDRMELLESRAILFTCPAGIAELERIEPELERLRTETNTYSSDAAAPETALLMRGNGRRLREVAKLDELRARSQPIAEWRDLVLRSTLGAFAGDYDDARRCCDAAGSIGEPFWGQSAAVLHAFGQLFIDSLSGEWDRSFECFHALRTASDSALFTAPYGWILVERGETEEAARVAADVRPKSFRWLGEHIMGGGVLVAAAELGLALDDERLCLLAEEHLLPFEDLVLGVPWACSLAAADPLGRLVARRGDESNAVRHRNRAAELYENLGAPALLDRLA